MRARIAILGAAALVLVAVLAYAQLGGHLSGGDGVEPALAQAVTPTPAPSGTTQVNITKFSAPVLVGGSCFEVIIFPGPNSFQVCDNNTQALDSDAVCLEDSTAVCEDLDPTSGQIRVAVAPGFYDVKETKPPVFHTPDPSQQICDPRPGGKCAVTFENASNRNPSFPWDIDGDGAVAFNDFLQLLQHFGERKP